MCFYLVTSCIGKYDFERVLSSEGFRLSKAFFDNHLGDSRWLMMRCATLIFEPVRSAIEGYRLDRRLRAKKAVVDLVSALLPTPVMPI